MWVIFFFSDIAKICLFMFFIISFFAGLILSRPVSNAGCGYCLGVVSFIFGVGIHIGCVYVSILLFHVFFEQHMFMLFMTPFISLGIVVAIACVVQKMLEKYY